MRREILILMLALSLSACQKIPANAPIDASAERSSQSIASSSAMAISENPALDQSFSSKELGISFRYPSHVFVMDCDEDVRVTAEEGPMIVTFIQEWIPGEKCSHLGSGSFSEIFAKRVSNKQDIRAFIDTVFSPTCLYSEEPAPSQDGDAMTRLFLRSKTPPKDGPDFVCSESILWDHTAGVVMYSPLASKNGGGIDWPSREPITVDGGTEGGFDFAIMRSLKFLKKN